MGNLYSEQNELTQAKNYYQKAIDLNPNYSEAYLNLGLVLHELGELDRAQAAYQQAIAFNPNVLGAQLGLADLLKDKGQLTEALTRYHQALNLNPTCIDAHLGIAGILVEQGDLAQAANRYQQALSFEPNAAQAYFGLGVIYKKQGQIEASLAAYKKAIAIEPGYIDAYMNLANELCEIGQFQAAITHYQTILTMRPDSVAAYLNLAHAYCECSNFELAITHYQAALKLAPQSTDAHYGLGVAFMHQANHSLALYHFEQALLLKPDYFEAESGIAKIFHEQGYLEKALAAYERALAIEPDYLALRHAKAFILLTLGQYREGWENYIGRSVEQCPPPYPDRSSGAVPLLTRKLKNRRILLWADQGIGDELLFLRYAPLLKERGAWVGYKNANKKLWNLLARQSSLDQLVELNEDIAFDEQFLISELPYALQTESQIPPSLQLTVLTDRLEAMKAKLHALGEGPYIGVTWRAGTKPDNHLKKGTQSLYKEIPLELFAEPLKRLNANIIVLQRHPAASELEALSGFLGKPVHDFSAINEDLEDMLALLSLLDNYIGVSNTNMHLLAGLGKTAKVLMPNPPDWRWLAEGSESPWFPDFKIYRQTQDKNWQPVLATLKQDLI